MGRKRATALKMLPSNTRNVFGPTVEVSLIESAVLAEGYGIAKQLGVDLVALVNRIDEFSIGERVAVVEFVDRFWNWTELREGAKDCADVMARIKQSIEYTASLGNSRHSNALSLIAHY